VESPYYRELQNCIGGTHSSRWISIEERETWPSRDHPKKNELAIYGNCYILKNLFLEILIKIFHCTILLNDISYTLRYLNMYIYLLVSGLQPDEFAEDAESWRTAVRNYWSLLSPLIFSDHPKRPGDEDPPPPYNMLRNVLDMNAHFGGFNSALLQSGKSVWVMNVVPTSGLNYLPLIQDRGYVGVLHDWYFNILSLVLEFNNSLFSFLCSTEYKIHSHLLNYFLPFIL
jgi:hypothetical protein